MTSRSDQCAHNIHDRCTWQPCTCTCGHQQRTTNLVAATYDNNALSPLGTEVE